MNPYIIFIIIIVIIALGVFLGFFESKKKNKGHASIPISWPYKNPTTDLALLPSSNDFLFVKRNNEEYKIPILKNDEWLRDFYSAKKTNLAFAIATKKHSGEYRLLEIVLPQKDEAINQFKIIELVNSKNLKIPLSKLYDKTKHGPIDDKILGDLKVTSLSRYTIMKIYDVSPNGNYLLLSRGDLELLGVNPIAISSFCSTQPWLYDIKNKRFEKVFPDINKSK